MEECKYKPTERMGLYILVILILFQTCSLEDKIRDKHRDISSRLDKIEQLIKK